MSQVVIARSQVEARYPERALWTSLIELTTELGDTVHGKAGIAAARKVAARKPRSMSPPAPLRRRPINWRWHDWPKIPLRSSKASFVSLPRDAGRWASSALR
ncbi:MAG TPA: hypothetical protein VK681_16585 [Reyranella sp.]|nr:hypothetical protein [Reyranella sp.]